MLCGRVKGPHWQVASAGSFSLFLFIWGAVSYDSSFGCRQLMDNTHLPLSIRRVNEGNITTAFDSTAFPTVIWLVILLLRPIDKTTAITLSKVINFVLVFTFTWDFHLGSVRFAGILCHTEIDKDELIRVICYIRWAPLSPSRYNNISSISPLCLPGTLSLTHSC